jgi:HEPN domain-containing protein
MNPKAERWLELANEDIEMADYAFSRRIFRQTCFHAQQAVEKALKGLLDARLGTHPKSHSLEQMLLYDAGIHTELRKWRTPCRNLDRFYIPTRYADALPGLLPAGEPTETDAQDALNDAKAIVTEIRKKIGAKK